jgi:hypothetical protein
MALVWIPLAANHHSLFFLQPAWIRASLLLVLSQDLRLSAELPVKRQQHGVLVLT